MEGEAVLLARTEVGEGETHRSTTKLTSSTSRLRGPSICWGGWLGKNWGPLLIALPG